MGVHPGRSRVRVHGRIGSHRPHTHTQRRRLGGQDLQGHRNSGRRGGQGQGQMNGLLQLLTIIFRLLGRAVTAWRRTRAQKRHDAVERDPAADFLRRFRGPAEPDSAPLAAERDRQ